MKITWLVHNINQFGGIEQVVCGLSNYFSYNLNYQVKIVSLCSYDGRPPFPLDEAVVITHCRLDWDNRITKKRRATIRQILTESDADILITCNVDTSAEALMYKRLFKGKLVVTQHSVCEYFSFRRRILNALVFRFADAFVVLTTHDQMLYRRAFCKSIVIPNAMFTSVSKRSPLVEPMLLAMGRLESVKGFDMLIDAFASVAVKHSEWKLCICGDGSLSDDLKHQAAKYSLEDRICFPGFVRPTDYMSRASGFVLSSRSEGFGLVLLEAMAHGLPIISHQLAPVMDLFGDGNGALIVPCNDVSQLAEKMDLLMESKELRDELSERSLELSEHYTVEAIAQHWVKLFDDLIR